jgi:hypothetical protein
MIHTLSCASTDTPIVIPVTQWFGIGFGHMGSTSNLGAVTPAACTVALFRSTAEPTPNTTTTASKTAPIKKFRFMICHLFSGAKCVC